ncbi:MAG: hypothetical protein ACXQT2_03745 [Methanotrichaceae archaeon]
MQLANDSRAQADARNGGPIVGRSRTTDPRRIDPPRVITPKLIYLIHVHNLYDG